MRGRTLNLENKIPDLLTSRAKRGIVGGPTGRPGRDLYGPT